MSGADRRRASPPPNTRCSVSLYALPGKLIGGLSGAVVDRWGYPALFTATALIALPLVVLCFIVRRDTMQAKETIEDSGAGEPAAAASRA